MKEIKHKFQELFKSSLIDFIKVLKFEFSQNKASSLLIPILKKKGDTSSDFQRILLTLIGEGSSFKK